MTWKRRADKERERDVAKRKNNKKESVCDRKIRKKGNRQILFLTYIIVAVFVVMIGNLAYFLAVDGNRVINNSYNRRQTVLAKKVQKGKILSADNKVLAETKTDSDGNDTRIYPYGKIFCHAVGRSKNSMTGIEKNYCYPMLTSHVNPVEQLIDKFKGEKTPGDNVVTTLNADLQKVAYDALGNNKGAAIAIEPSTGKILAMVSKPAYDPNNVDKIWNSLVKESNDDSKLINRATQGLYPPGSTFKVMTAMEYIIENPDKYKKFSYNCHGTDSFSGNVINCYGKEKHGKVDLEKAFAKSCNGAFAKIGSVLNNGKFREFCEDFYFNNSINVDFEYNKSVFSLTDKSDMGEITQTAMGQGKTMITPLQNAMICSTIANKGKMMQPYIVDHIENNNGGIVTEYSPKEKGQIISSEVADEMNKLMKAVVSEGTGRSLSYLSYKVAGKTGSAEYDSKGNSHAWFVGYAPAENPKIAVSVVVEGAGTGSQYAVPVAKSMFISYLGK